MKPPRRVDPGPRAVADPLAGLIAAAKAGTLVALLRGEGLNRRTVRELLSPESAVRLHAVLTDGVAPAGRLLRFRPRDGKLLPFKARKRPGS